MIKFKSGTLIPILQKSPFKLNSPVIAKSDGIFLLRAKLK
jgi:hypothetical protein